MALFTASNNALPCFRSFGRLRGVRLACRDIHNFWSANHRGSGATIRATEASRQITTRSTVRPRSSHSCSGSGTGRGLSRRVFQSTSDIGNGTAAGGRDTLADFEQGFDRIDLSAIDANTLVGGNQSFSLLATAGAAFTEAAQLRFVHQTIGGVGHTIIEGNVNGGLSSPEFRIDFIGLYAPTAGNFVL